ncbi:MAG: hypothetical protein ACI8RZ_005645 [Myxococcota bacterium]|jgi:hypothetical protein
MLALMTLAVSAAASHSAATAAAISHLGEVLGAPVLIALEGNPDGPAWLRISGWLKVPVSVVPFPMSTDPYTLIHTELSRSGLPCAVHLRQTQDGWEGALLGACGDLRLPEGMALTESVVAPAVSFNGESVPEMHHGFRVGYAYTRDDSFAAPHLLVMGYEVSQEITGGGGLDVLMLANLSISGLNQSVAWPTLNLLIGCELSDALQIGVGPSIAWTMPEDKVLHMVLAAGWEARAGTLGVPLHFAWIPDVDGEDRFIATTGVTF